MWLPMSPKQAILQWRSLLKQTLKWLFIISLEAGGGFRTKATHSFHFRALSATPRSIHLKVSYVNCPCPSPRGAKIVAAVTEVR